MYVYQIGIGIKTNKMKTSVLVTSCKYIELYSHDNKYKCSARCCVRNDKYNLTDDFQAARVQL